MTRRLPIFLVPLAALLLTACGGEDYGGDSASEPAAATAPAANDAAAGESVESESVAQESTSGTNTVIIRAAVQLRSDDVIGSVDEVVNITERFGGSITDRSVVNSGSGTDEASASLTVRVPPNQAEEFMAALESAGTVASMNQTAEDVADQLVDLDVRIENARASVDRIRELMQSTTDIDELTDLEAELTDRQTTLEQLLAQQQNLSGEAAMATIEVSIVSTASAQTPEPTDASLSDAASRGWNLFIQIVYAILLAVAFFGPFLILLLIAYVVLRWYLSRRKKARAKAQTMAAPQSPPNNQTVPHQHAVQMPHQTASHAAPPQPSEPEQPSGPRP